MNGYLNVRKIKKIAIVYFIIGLILTIVFVIGITFRPVSKKLKKIETQRLIYLLKDKKAIIDAYILRYEDIAKQITSRTKIREKLKEYNQGKVSLDELKKFTIPKLKDAMRFSPYVKGVVRFSKENKPLLAIGPSIPEEYLKIIINTDHLWISTPFKKDNHQYIVISLPIIDMKGNIVGKDAVIIDFSPLSHLIENEIASFPYASFILGSVENGKIKVFFKKGKDFDPFILQNIENIVKDQNKSKDIDIFVLKQSEKTYPIIGAYAKIRDTNWILSIVLKKNFLEIPIISILRTSIGWTILSIIFAFLVMFSIFLIIINKSERKVRELEEKVSTKSIQLIEEIQRREHIEELYNININFLATVLDTISIPISAKDRQGQYIFVNKAFIKVTGKRPEEIIGKTIKEIWKNEPEIVKTLEDLDKKVIENGESIVHDFKYTKNSGKIIYGVITKVPFFHDRGEIIGVVSTFLDLTERRKMEEEILRLASLVEQTTNYIVITDTNGVIQYVNPAFTEITGYTKEEVIGKTPRILKSGRHSKEFYKEFWDTLKRGDVWRGEFIDKRKNGEEYYDFTVAFPIKDMNGNIINFAAIKRDITEEKIKEKRVNQAQKMETIGRLVGGIAHDFNNLLTVILGYSEILLNKLSEGDPLYRYIKKIRETGEKAKELISKLLAFGRKQIYKPKIINANDYVADVCNIIKRVVPEDIEVVMSLSPEPLYIYADPVQIEQIIMNLIVNAKDAMEEKEKVLGKSYKKLITIETESVYLDSSYVRVHPGSREGEFVLISVSDNGIGINKEIIDKIFEPFFTTKEEGKGTGLGLSTVYGIVKQNNANIYVYSESMKGTTFKIYWPKVEEEKEEEEKNSTFENIFMGNETVLIVEDNQGVRNFMKESLVSLGYKVYEAENGEDALKFAKDNKNIKIDLLITDIIMPKMDGEELSRKMKEFYPQLKVLFTSGYTHNYITRNSALKKDIEFLQKPFSLKALAQKVREILNK